MKKRSKKKLGIALGAGGAKGLAHIGVLKALHKHNIYPDYIAGTSMGAAIGAVYASGYSPLEIEQIAKTTDWRNIVDFTVPKSGLIRGKNVEKKLIRLVGNKEFSELNIPLRVVSYNLTAHERVVFSKGDVAQAVRASISIPGVFTPVKISKQYYIDGGVTDPTPFDIVRDMGADVIIAVDLFVKEKTVTGPAIHKESLFSEFKRKFIAEELGNVKNLIFPEEWPPFIRRMLIKIFDKLVYPARILRILAGRELPPIAKIVNETVHVLSNNLAREKLEHADVDVKLTPSFRKLGWSDFDKVDEFVRIGERAMMQEIRLLKKKLGKK